MGLESGTYIPDLVISNPTDNDQESQGAAHLRLIKQCLRNSFPALQDKFANCTSDDLNSLSGIYAYISASGNTLMKGWLDATYDTPGARNSAISSNNTALINYINSQNNLQAWLTGAAFTGAVSVPTLGNGNASGNVGNTQWFWNQVLAYGFVTTAGPYGAPAQTGGGLGPVPGSQICWFTVQTSGGRALIEGGYTGGSGSQVISVGFPVSMGTVIILNYVTDQPDAVIISSSAGGFQLFSATGVIGYCRWIAIGY
jgi:hypothetical protein